MRTFSDIAKHTALIFALLTVAAPSFAETPAADGTAPPPQTVGEKQRCPVCGMYPARYPLWQVQVIFRDRGMVAIESPAEFLRYRAEMKRYDTTHRSEDIAQVYFSDHAGSGWIRAEQAAFVEGSDAKGPMGADSPAFRQKQDAEQFARQHGGKVIAFDALPGDHGTGHHHHTEH